MLEETDKKILKLAQGDLPIIERPFTVWADELGISEAELIERLKSLNRKGIIRDFKAILRHGKAGIAANAMVTWAVEESTVENAGRKLAEFDAITHCYERPDFGKYNVFTMIHAKTRNALLETIKEIAQKTGLSDYKIYFSISELKKTSMQYF